MSRTVLVTDYAWQSLDIERAILGEVDAELLVAETGEAAELVELAPAADAILTNWKALPAAALDAASKCLVVSRYGVGLDNIPVAHATELGILVTNVPDFCLEEVSDHTLALLLACARRIVSFAVLTRAGGWGLEGGRGMPRLRGQTLGLVGFGNIARTLVPKAQGFGLQILAYTPRLSAASAPDSVEVTGNLDELLARSDYVSIHAPATPETAGLIGERELRLMKPTAYLINTSRGALVNEDALARAVTEGWIAGAALDVLRQEPAAVDHPLRGIEGVILTPHASFYSETAIAELEAKAARNVAEVLSGRIPQTTVNPDVLAKSNLRLSTARTT